MTASARLRLTSRRWSQFLRHSYQLSAFLRKAINIFVEELEKNPDLAPEHFIITCTARKDISDKKRR